MDYDRPPDTITEGLASLNVDALKPLASLCTSRVPTRKQELIDLVYRSLQDPAFVAEQVGALDRTAKLGLAEAVYGDGTVEQGRFQAHYGVPFTLPATSWSYGGAARRSPDSVRLGLFFYQGRVPRDLRPRLRELLPVPAPFVLPTSDALPEAMISEDDEAEPVTVLSTEEAATHDLLTTLRLAAQGKLAVGEATHQPTAGAVRLLREGYLLPDVPTAEEASRADDAVRPFGFTMIVQAAGLARAVGTRLTLTAAGQAALEGRGAVRPPDLLRKCWQAWVGWNKLDELSRVRGIKGQKAKGQRFTPPSGRKAAVAAALATCPAGRWIALADFFRHVRINHDFVVEAGSYSHLYVGYSSEGGWLDYSGVDTWTIVHGAYIRVILLEYAATLGLIDVAAMAPDEAPMDVKMYSDLGDTLFSRYQGLLYLRINPLGAYILGQSERYEAPAPRVLEPTLRVLPNLDVVVARRAELQPNDRAILERFTTRASDDVYRLSRHSLLEAAEQGMDPPAVQEFLASRAGPELPATVGRLLQDVGRSVAALPEAGPALLVRCAEPRVTQLLSHDNTLGKLCLAAGEHHVVVPAANLAAFRRGLKRLGYVLPATANLDPPAPRATRT